MKIARVALDVPLPRLFDYLAPDSDESDIGRRANVPFGRALKTGVVMGFADASEQPVDKLKPVAAILRDMPALPADWLALCEFCARYYLTPLGEVASFALPPMLRRGKLPRMPKAAAVAVSPAPTPEMAALPALLPAQQSAVAALIAAREFQTYLLHGVTGSGKTEVYLRAIAEALAGGGQALMLVPEIALTPQLEGRVAARFPVRARGVRQQRHGRRGARARLSRCPCRVVPTSCWAPGLRCSCPCRACA
jgi:primosomal protein N' (replication factor Y)